MTKVQQRRRSGAPDNWFPPEMITGLYDHAKACSDLYETCLADLRANAIAILKTADRAEKQLPLHPPGPTEAPVPDYAELTEAHQALVDAAERFEEAVAAYGTFAGVEHPGSTKQGHRTENVLLFVAAILLRDGRRFRGSNFKPPWKYVAKVLKQDRNVNLSDDRLNKLVSEARKRKSAWFADWSSNRSPNRRRRLQKMVRQDAERKTRPSGDGSG